MNAPPNQAVLMKEGEIVGALERIRYTLQFMKAPDLSDLISALEGLQATAFREMVNREIVNPRCYCPDCGADLGDFKANRIRMEERYKR